MFAQTTSLNLAPAEVTVDPVQAAPSLAAPRVDPLALPGIHQQSEFRRTQRGMRPDLRRVLAMTLTATLHISLLAALLLPDKHPVTARSEHPTATAADAPDRLTVFVGLQEPIAPSPPPRPPAAVPAAPPLPRETTVPVVIASADSIPAPALPDTEVSPIDQTPPADPILSRAMAAADDAAHTEPSADEDAASTTTTPSIAPDVARREREAYIQALMAALLQQRVYPAAARKEREQGVVHVRFTIDRDGQLLDASVQRGAGLLLDAAALQVLQRAAPLPAIPVSMGKQTLTITVPIEYSLTTR